MKTHSIHLSTILSVIAVLFCITPLTISAQTSTYYDLSKYKLPEIRYRALMTEFNLAGNGGSGNLADLKTSSQSFRGYASAFYNSYLNSAKTQRNQTINLGLRGYSDDREDTLKLLDNSDYSTYIWYQIDNKRYFRHKLFIGTSLDARYSYLHNKYYQDIMVDTIRMKSDYISYSHKMKAGIPLAIGIGRVEQVQDFYKAIYLYEDLLKNGRAVAGKSNEEVMELAKLISQLKYKRYYDFRIKNMQDIETLDSFLLANNFKTISDARYFATLVDNWNFVNYFERRSGTVFSLTAKPEFVYEFMDNTDNLIDHRNELTTKTYSIYGGVNFEHYKPLNLYWQSDTWLSAQTGFTETSHDNSVDPKTSVNHPEFSLSFNQSLSYYPNTRTQMRASIFANYIKILDEKDDAENILRHESENINSGLSLSVDYYISPKLRLDINSALKYSHYNMDKIPSRKSNSFYAGFGATLSYSIF